MGRETLDRLQLTLLGHRAEVDEVGGFGDEGRGVGQTGTNYSSIRTTLSQISDVGVITVEICDLGKQHLDGQRAAHGFATERSLSRACSRCWVRFPVISAL